MAYNLLWPGLQDLDVYIIDHETKTIYDKERRLPIRLNSINTLEHKYVRLIDIVSLFPNSMKVRVLNLVETLSSISSLKPLFKDKLTELRFLHLSSLLAFILVYPFCKPFQKTRDAILRFLMGYTETVCMDCGFIQRECQCHMFNAVGDAVDGEDITEVVCKVSEWKSCGTQTDDPGKTVDSSTQKVLVNLPAGFKLKTSDGRIVVSGGNKDSAASQPQIGPVITGSMPTIVPSSQMQGPPVYNIPTVTSFPSTFNPLQQMTNMPFGFLGTPPGPALGTIASSSPTSLITIPPPVPSVVSQAVPSTQDTLTGTSVRMGSNVLYVPPDAMSKKSEALTPPIEKQDTRGTKGNLFKLDPKSGLFVSDDFSLDPKTGKVTKNTDTNKKNDGEKETWPHNMGENRPKKRRKQILVRGNQVFIEDDEKLNEDILTKRKKKKRKKSNTVKSLLEKEHMENISDVKRTKDDVTEKNPDKVSSEYNNNKSDKVTEEVDACRASESAEGDQLNEKELENEIENIEKNGEEDTEKESKDEVPNKVKDGAHTPKDNEISLFKTDEKTETIDISENSTEGKIRKEKKKDDYNGPEKGSDIEGASDNSESSSEGDGTDTGDGEISSEEEDVQIFDGVRYKVITPKPHSKATVKPPQLKVKMPFSEKLKPNIPAKIKPTQKFVIKTPETPSTPGSILSKCNFSYTPSPTTGAPILQPIKKTKLPGTTESAPGKPNAVSSGKDKSCFSVIPHNSNDTGKGYAKFEFAQTGEKMLRCIIYTCGQVFDTEQFAEIHHTLHQNGTPKELRCKLCGFKGHILKWYDMLRHLKQTHGLVLNPKILPPKPKKTDEKKSEGAKEKQEEECSKDKKSDLEKESKDRVECKDSETKLMEKTDNDAEASIERDSETGGNSSSPVKEECEKKSNDSSVSQSDMKSPDENATSTELKSDGLSALADVCDQLEPMDTSSSTGETTREESLESKENSTVKTSPEKSAEADNQPKKEEETKTSVMENGERSNNSVENSDIKDNTASKVETTLEKAEAESTKEIEKEDEKEKGEKKDNEKSETSQGEKKDEKSETSHEQQQMCDLCGIKFDTKKELDNHSTFHYYNKYKCVHCGGIMYTWEHLQRHLKECTDVDKGRVYYNCQYCHLSFRDRKSHYIHSISHGDPGLVCSYCDDNKSWDNWTALKKHYKVFHMAMRLLSAFKCDECNREFNTAKQYNNHVQDHKRRKERAAKMNKADQKEIDDMKDMEIEVTEDGLVKCPDCDQTFKNNHYMQMHHKFKHGEEITCPKCSYVAKSKLMLKIHMGKSHVEKSHKCGECGKTFAHYHQYKVHLSTHAQKTTFTCKFCQAGYPTNGELRQHMFKEHKLPAHKKLIQCEECDFKCFSRTTLKAHARKNHPETSVVEDGEDHCYFNKKEPSPPPKPEKKSKSKFKNQESVEKMLETKSKYFVMRHNTCCRTRSFEQNMEIKNRKMAAEKRLLEGPKKRGRKPKSIFEAAVEPEDPQVAEKKDPTWSPVKDDSEVTNISAQSSSSEKSSRRSSYVTASTPTEDFSQEDIHKIHENRAPNKRRSAPPKRYSPEREVVQVKKRAKSPPTRRPRSPKERRRPSKSPVYKKRKSISGIKNSDSLNLSYFQQQSPLLSSTPYETTQSVKERRRSAKQYEKRLKQEKPTLYAELMHVKKLKSVPMVVDQSVPVSVPLMDHCYCRESKPVSPPDDQYDDVSYIHPDLSIVNTPDVADFEECLTDDVEIPSPVYSYNRSTPPVPVPTGRQGRGRGRPSGRGRPTERRQQPVAMRGVLTGGSVSTLHLTNSAGQFSKLGTLLSDDKGSGVNVRIAGTSASVTPSATSQVRTVMATPHDDSLEFDGDTFLPPGVEMQDDILKVAADMFIGENGISEEITETSDHESQIPVSLGLSTLQTTSNSVSKYPKPIVITRPDSGLSLASSMSSNRKRVITISQQGLIEHTQSRVVTETVPQMHTEAAVITETIPHYEPQDSETVTETIHFESNEDITEDASLPIIGTEVQAHHRVSDSVSHSDTGDTIVSVTPATNLQNVESDPGMTNEMAQELVQAILDHSRTSDTDLDDIQLNEADYTMLLGSRGDTTSSDTVVTTAGNTVQITLDKAKGQARSLDHQYF